MPGYELRYEVSDAGLLRRVMQVRGTGTGRVITGGYGPGGRHKVHLWRDGKRITVYVHDLVAAVFLGPRPEGKLVAFRNGDQTNPAADNLCYRKAVRGRPPRIHTFTRAKLF